MGSWGFEFRTKREYHGLAIGQGTACDGGLRAGRKATTNHRKTRTGRVESGWSGVGVDVRRLRFDERRRRRASIDPLGWRRQADVRRPPHDRLSGRDSSRTLRMSVFRFHANCLSGRRADGLLRPQAISLDRRLTAPIRSKSPPITSSSRPDRHSPEMSRTSGAGSSR